MIESISSGRIRVGTKQVFKGECSLSGILVLTDGANNATVQLFDTDDGSQDGKLLFEIVVLAANRYGGRNFSFPVRVAKGLTCVVSGTNASCTVEYVEKVK